MYEKTKGVFVIDGGKHQIINNGSNFLRGAIKHGLRYGSLICYQVFKRLIVSQKNDWNKHLKQIHSQKEKPSFPLKRERWFPVLKIEQAFPLNIIFYILHSRRLHPVPFGKTGVSFPCILPN